MDERAECWSWGLAECPQGCFKGNVADQTWKLFWQLERQVGKQEPDFWHRGAHAFPAGLAWIRARARMRRRPLQPPRRVQPGQFPAPTLGEGRASIFFERASTSQAPPFICL